MARWRGGCDTVTMMACFGGAVDLARFTALNGSLDLWPSAKKFLSGKDIYFKHSQYQDSEGWQSGQSCPDSCHYVPEVDYRAQAGTGSLSLSSILASAMFGNVFSSFCSLELKIFGQFNLQVKVADALKERAPKSKPDLFINVGDNFYWGGVNTEAWT